MCHSLKWGVVFVLLINLFSCSTILDDNREFTEPMTGAVMIAQSILQDEPDKNGCEATSKAEITACQKGVNTLLKSIDDFKRKQ